MKWEGKNGGRRNRIFMNKKKFKKSFRNKLQARRRAGEEGNDGAECVSVTVFVPRHVWVCHLPSRSYHVAAVGWRAAAFPLLLYPLSPRTA